mmetsp:Transcript_14644/g.16282  ORF Transcript_14644/g.16282 Transcript_14644/m.16282 type:complete len:81 (+) Transcript_14644:96-338(+)
MRMNFRSDTAKNSFLIGSGVLLGYCITTGGPGIFTIIVAGIIVFSMARVLSTEKRRSSEKDCRSERDDDSTQCASPKRYF